MTEIIFCDIDGTILFQSEKDIWDPYNYKEHNSNSCAILKGAKQKLTQWHMAGHWIILTTSRTESMREITLETLAYYGIIYNQLIMNIPQGRRHLINNTDDLSIEKAKSYNILTNQSITSIDI